jgi:hypothetical protein
MPSTSEKQHRFMEGIAHGMKPRGGKGPSVAVAKEFVAADKSEGKYDACRKGGYDARTGRRRKG